MTLAAIVRRVQSDEAFFAAVLQDPASALATEGLTLSSADRRELEGLVHNAVAVVDVPKAMRVLKGRGRKGFVDWPEPSWATMWIPKKFPFPKSPAGAIELGKSHVQALRKVLRGR